MIQSYFYCVYTFQCQHVTRHAWVALGLAYSHKYCFLCMSEYHYDLRREDSSSMLLNQLTKDLLLNSEQRNHLSVGLKHMCEERESQKKKKDHGKAGAYIEEIDQGEWVCESSFPGTKERPMEFSDLYAAVGVKKTVLW